MYVETLFSNPIELNREGRARGAENPKGLPGTEFQGPLCHHGVMG